MPPPRRAALGWTRQPTDGAVSAARQRLKAGTAQVEFAICLVGINIPDVKTNLGKAGRRTTARNTPRRALSAAQLPSRRTVRGSPRHTYKLRKTCNAFCTREGAISAWCQIARTVARA